MLFYFVQLGSEHSISDSHQVKAEYLSCLRSLYHLISNGMTSEIGQEKEIKDEIQRVEGEISKAGKSWSLKPLLEEPLAIVDIHPEGNNPHEGLVFLAF